MTQPASNSSFVFPLGHRSQMIRIIIPEQTLACLRFPKQNERIEFGSALVLPVLFFGILHIYRWLPAESFLLINGRVDLLRFRVRADILVELPVLLCKGRAVFGEPGKDKQDRHTSSHIGRHLPIKKASGPHEPHGMVAPGRWKSAHCSDHRNSGNLPRTRFKEFPSS